MFPTDMSACHYMEDHIKATRDIGSGGKENWKTEGYKEKKENRKMRKELVQQIIGAEEVIRFSA